MASSLGLHVFLAAVFAYLHLPLLIWINLAGAAIYGACIALVRRGIRHWIAVNTLTWLAILSSTLISTWMLGWRGGFQYNMWLLIPLIFFGAGSTQRKVIQAILVIGINIGAAAIFPGRAPQIEISESALFWLQKFNIAVYLGISGFLALIYSLAMSEAERKLHTLAITDVLTGLPNRRHLMSVAAKELYRAQRKARPLSIVLLDIDYFKMINDHFGHAGGDHVLTEISDVLRKTVRAEDHVARWGGEEFIVLMPGVALEAAQAAAERIRQAFMNTMIEIETPGFVTSSLRISATLGVSQCHPTESIEQCIARADAAMYRGKLNGRNHVEVSNTYLRTGSHEAKGTRSAAAR